MKSVFVLLLVLFLQPSIRNCVAAEAEFNSEEIVRGSWAHYKRTFIKNGRVIRPQNNNDTVSEGEAYAMLRAVLMDDKETFDACLLWTESMLSRKDLHGDTLLAWHFENGRISDATAATDADIDYAYSLVLAFRKWDDASYLNLAQKVLKSVLDKESTRVNSRLYLLPWPVDQASGLELVAQNPSYYAPSHFKLFYEVTGDKRWLELVDSGYDLIESLQNSFGEKHEGLVPDWCALDLKGNIVALPGKNSKFGWDAVRVPFRIAADYYLNDDRRALNVLMRFSGFFEREFNQRGKILCGYSLDDSSETPLETPLFYSAAYAAMKPADSVAAPLILLHLRDFLHNNGDEFYYNEPDDYYVNSLAWFPEFYYVTKTGNTP